MKKLKYTIVLSLNNGLIKEIDVEADTNSEAFYETIKSTEGEPIVSLKVKEIKHIPQSMF